MSREKDKGNLITSVSVRNFRGIRKLHDVSLPGKLVLMGANGSGKSTFLDVFRFAQDCVIDGPTRAMMVRGFVDICWDAPIELEFFLNLEGSRYRYHFALERTSGQTVRVLSETLSQLKKGSRPRTILGKGGNGFFYARGKSSRRDIFKFDSSKLALAQTLPDARRYPAALAVKRFFTTGIQYGVVDNFLGRVSRFLGVSEGFVKRMSAASRWVESLKSIIPDLENIGWFQNQHDGLVLRYADGREVPWRLLSGGIVRILMLTLPMFLSRDPTLYLLEEPESGIHPKAMRAVLDVFRSSPNAQIIMTTYSPDVTRHWGLEGLLFFGYGPDGVFVKVP